MWWLGASVFSSSEEHYNAIPTLLKTGIILGGVIVSIGILLGIWGYWRARKRKTNRRYRAVRYSTASYITWSLNAIDSVLLVKVRASSETFGHLLKRTRLILGFRWCVSCNFFAFIYKRCIVDIDEKKLWMWEYNVDVYGSNIILCSCMNDYKSLRLCIILHDWKQKYSPRPRQNTCFRSPGRSLIYLFFLDEYAWWSASVFLNNLLLIE